MTYQILHSRYIVLGGVPIATPVCMARDLNDFDRRTPIRGSDVLVPYQEGQQPRTHRFDAARKVVPVIFYGRYDFDGTLHTDADTGYDVNRDELNKAFRPRRTNNGLTSLEYHLPDETVRVADVRVLDFELNRQRGTDIAYGAIDIQIPGGVLRAEDPVTHSFSTAGDKTVENPGTVQQFAVQITLSGAATLINESWADHTLEYTGSDPITINTAAATAVYGDGTTAMGEVDWPGDNMFPLVVGDNTVNITSGVTVEFEHYPAFS